MTEHVQRNLTAVNIRSIGQIQNLCWYAWINDGKQKYSLGLDHISNTFHDGAGRRILIFTTLYSNIK